MTIKQGIIGALFWGMLAQPISAKLIFEWRDTSVPEQERGKIEQRLQRVALKYTEQKYADLGAYNFITAEERYVIQIGNEAPFLAGHSAARRTVILRQCFPCPQLDIVFFHELDHAYAYAMGDIRLRFSVKNPSVFNWYLTESRALQKEYLYIDEIQNVIPKKYYQKFQECKENDISETYRKRGILMKEWIKEYSSSK